MVRLLPSISLPSVPPLAPTLSCCEALRLLVPPTSTSVLVCYLLSISNAPFLSYLSQAPTSTRGPTPSPRAANSSVPVVAESREVSRCKPSFLPQNSKALFGENEERGSVHGQAGLNRKTKNCIGRRSGWALCGVYAVVGILCYMCRLLRCTLSHMHSFSIHNYDMHIMNCNR